MRQRSEVVVGVVILLSALLVFLGTLWLKGERLGQQEMTIEARFREVGQLMVGNAVKLRGVPIGEVESIALEPGGEGVIVRLRIDRDAPLPADPVVLLSMESMFGDWQAEIFPRERFPTYAYAESPDPAVLPGYSLPDISRLTAAADQIAANLATLTDRVELAFTEETAHNIRSAIENIEEVSGALTRLVGSQQQAIDEVAANLAAATETVSEAAEAMRRAFTEVEAAVADGELTQIVDNIERTTAQLDTLTARLAAASGQFGTTIGVADSTLRAVGAVATRLQQGEGTLGRLLQDTTLYSDLVRTNALLQALLEDFKANPGKYIKLEIF
ncbi:MAG TPA: MlaD family protein [Longimicrobiales bacterium]